MKLRAALLLGLCLAAGAARAGMFDDDEARKAVTNLRVQVEANQKAAEDRLAKMEALVQDRSIDTAKQIDELKQDLANMRGQLEVQAHQIESLDRRQKDLYVDLDTRLRKLEASAKEQEKQAASAPDPVAEGKAYEAALNQFKLGNYQASVAAFQSFLATYPDSQQVSSAQYWIGNAYYALRDYKTAIAAQQKVLASWPNSAKAPDALLNIASCQAETGPDADRARDAAGAAEEISRHPGGGSGQAAPRRQALAGNLSRRPFRPRRHEGVSSVVQNHAQSRRSPLRGLDSATVLALAQREGYACHALSVDYGQRHRVELEAAVRVARALGAVEHKTVRVDLTAFGGSALTDDTIAVPTARRAKGRHSRHLRAGAQYHHAFPCARLGRSAGGR